MTNEQKSSLKKWAEIACLILLLICGLKIWNMVYDRRIKEIAAPPAKEIAKTDAAITTIEQHITAYKETRQNIEKVVKNEKKQVVAHVDAISDDAVADEWNTMLRQYRDNTAAAGMGAD